MLASKRYCRAGRRPVGDRRGRDACAESGPRIQRRGGRGSRPCWIADVALASGRSGAVRPLFVGALGVALFSFTNAMVVARSFAAKGGYEVNANQEFLALGVSQIAAGLSGAFAVSGTESRTGMNYAAGGKSPLAGLIAAGVMAAVLVFFTAPLSYLPMAALGAVLIVAAMGLFDVAELRRFVARQQARIRLGNGDYAGRDLPGCARRDLAAVGIALVMVLFRVAAARRRPRPAPGLPGFHNVDYHVRTLPGMVSTDLGRHCGSSTRRTSNGGYWTWWRRKAKTRWLIVDALPSAASTARVRQRCKNYPPNFRDEA